MALVQTNSNVVSSPNATAWSVELVTVVTAGVPVQGPAKAVPLDYSVAILAPSSNGNKSIFVATSSVNALDPAKRVELKGGQSLQLKIADTNLIWFDASQSGLTAQLIVEG